jgi:hypothetical protein
MLNVSPGVYMKYIMISLLLIFSCARVEVVRLNEANANSNGIRYYRPYPYLFVTLDKDNKIQSTIVWLPNIKEEYAINYKSGIGSVDAKFKLNDGWNLTEYGEIRDSKTSEMITAITGFTGTLTDVVDIFKSLEVDKSIYTGLYKIEFDEKGFVKGVTPVILFKSSVKK